MAEAKFNLRSTIHDNQLAYIVEKAKKDLQTSVDEEDLRLLIEEYYQDYIKNIGSPLYKRKLVDRHQVPFVEDFIETMDTISADVNIMYKEHDNTSKFITDTYNYMHSEKKRLLSEISGLNSLVGDLNLISNEQNITNLYFKESFENPKSQDSDFQLDGISSAQVSSTEGVLTLARSKTENISENARIASLEGNGEAGTGHIARRIQITDENGSKSSQYIFLNSNATVSNDAPDVLLDNRSDTIFEYQMVNVPTDFINQNKRYDFEWIKGNKMGTRLRLKVVVELDKVQTINWINVNPYYPANSTNRVNVYSIRTSKDGFEYEGLFEKDNFVIDKDLNETPETYKVEDLFDNSNNAADAKFTGQGVWGFKAREARFVEFVFDQTESYTETIGQEVYKVRTKNQEYWTQIPKVEELKDEPTGEYSRSLNGESVVYKKEIVATDQGWRHVIALRDINIMSYRFEPKSSFVSQKYEIDGEIAKVMLYANEKIPSEYMKIISESNDWIKYEVSFDDVNWHRISPMHQEPVDDKFPPKIYELNANEVDLASSFQIHKKLLKTEEKPNSVRFRVSLSRPDGIDYETTTPILEDVALRIVKKEDVL
ncbi:hypothetical protein ACFC9N_11440 [Enterococcus casseliflavus]|uniref:hypothetical protein n=1 Tax=Enterococcus TaxID=1350 RepID=UPI000A3B11E0|nr:hypothetical protein [Enterococcus sp. 4E1_DIV0656]OTO09300.1 hypothetical protein A5882_003633 [Enterococcus sp. 4E1_DIV0656]